MFEGLLQLFSNFIENFQFVHNTIFIVLCINYEVNTHTQIQKEQEKMFVQIILQALVLHYQFKNLAKISYKHTKTYLSPFIFKSPDIEWALLNCTRSTVLYVVLQLSLPVCHPIT